MMIENCRTLHHLFQCSDGSQCSVASVADVPFLPSFPSADNGGPAGNVPHYDEQGELQCPFHTYRSSTDIRPVYGSILVNLMTVPPLAKANLSVPGCWACELCFFALLCSNDRS